MTCPTLMIKNLDEILKVFSNLIRSFEFKYNHKNIVVQKKVMLINH